MTKFVFANFPTIGNNFILQTNDIENIKLSVEFQELNFISFMKMLYKLTF